MLKETDHVTRDEMTKADLMASIKLHRCHECFMHSTEGEFDVTLMRMAAQRGDYEKFTAPLDDELVELIKQIRDWDKDRVLGMTQEQISEPTSPTTTNTY